MQFFPNFELAAMFFALSKYKNYYKMNKSLSIILSVIVLAIGAYLIIKDFHKEQIKIWDESASAEVSVDMYANNNYLFQYEDGEPKRGTIKPPLNIWPKMICYHFFGINEFSVRLPSIIASLFTMLLLWYFGFFVLKRPRLGILFALILISSRGYVSYHVSRTGDPDALLVFFITIAILSLYQLIQKYPVKRNKYYIFLGIALLLAMYTKSIMGLAPLAGLGVYTLANKKGRRVLSDLRFYLTTLSALVLIIAYYVLREYLDPGYLAHVLRYEIFSFKEAPNDWVKHPEFSFYINYLFTEGFKPFMYIFPLSLLVYLYSKDNTIKELIKFTFWGIIIFILAMSAATLKNEWYIAPVYPFLAIFTGATLVGIKDIIKSKTKEKHHLIVSIVFVMIIIGLCINPIKKIDSANHHYKHSVYYFEREGRFFDSVKQDHPYIKDIGIIIPHHTRQLQFYINKYEYLDNTNTTIYKDIPGANVVGDTIIACDKDIKSKLPERFSYKVIDTDEYCKLIKIEKVLND